jgi:hypothetical protein
VLRSHVCAGNKRSAGGCSLNEVTVQGQEKAQRQANVLEHV